MSEPRSITAADRPADHPDELERLRAWKAEALSVLNDWERVWEAAGRPGQLGESKAAAVLKLFPEPAPFADPALCGLCGGAGDWQEEFINSAGGVSIRGGACSVCDGTGLTPRIRPEASGSRR